MLECENCHLEVENQTKLLRHISHKKVCKAYYGEYRLKDMRIEGKLESKKKWWNKNGKKVTQSYQIRKIRIREAKKQKNSASVALAPLDAAFHLLIFGIFGPSVSDPSSFFCSDIAE